MKALPRIDVSRESIPKVMTVGEVSKRSGVAISALHFYEEKGLVFSHRTSGNQRRYARDTLRRLAFIRAAQHVGVPLARVKQALAALPHRRTPTPDDWARLSALWKEGLDRRIAELDKLRDQLDGCIGCGCLSTTQCKLSNPKDRAAAYGPGSRLWDPTRT